MNPNEFLIVTERGGEAVSQAQLERFHQRYLWAGSLSAGKDVLEMACGTGPGLGYLQGISRSLCRRAMVRFPAAPLAGGFFLAPE